MEGGLLRFRAGAIEDVRKFVYDVDFLDYIVRQVFKYCTKYLVTNQEKQCSVTHALMWKVSEAWQQFLKSSLVFS
ncbi:hypothetical protein Pfo_029517 [Paulownia fortunei]|nr:hypothetical protein Pfo_029517 [Paulownia fortunei]